MKKKLINISIFIFGLIVGRIAGRFIVTILGW